MHPGKSWYVGLWSLVVLVVVLEVLLKVGGVKIMDVSNVITLGGDSNGFTMERTSSVGFFNHYLAVVDQFRVLLYPSTLNLTNGSAPSISLTSTSVTSYSNFLDNGVSGYVQDNVTHIWVGNPLAEYRRFSSPFSFNQTPDQVLNTPQFSQPILITVDVLHHVLYAVDISFNRVLTYLLSNLSAPIMVYGQNDFNSTMPNQGNGNTFPATATSLWQPYQVILGCANDIWILDCLNNRLLHYPPNSNIADNVIGQTSLTARDTGTKPSQLYRPKSAVINGDCSAIWIADTLNHRILKFKQPFYPGMNASEMIDSQQLDMQEPVSLALDTDGSRLWFADWNTSKVTGFHTDDVVVATPLPTATVPLNCSVKTTPGNCIINYPLVVGPNLTLQFNYSVLKVNNNLVLSNSSTVIIGSNQVIQSSGTVFFGGTLVIVLSSEKLDSLKNNKTEEFIVVRYNKTEGMFSSIVAAGEGGGEVGECGVKTEGHYESSSLGVLVTLIRCNDIPNSRDEGHSNVGMWIGVAVAAGVVAVLVLIVVVAVVVTGAVLLKTRERRGKGIVTF